MATGPSDPPEPSIPPPATNTGDRLIAIVLLGGVLFHPLLVGLFDQIVLRFGIPLLYLYLFTAWAVVILGLALTIELAPPASREIEGNDSGNGSV